MRKSKFEVEKPVVQSRSWRLSIDDRDLLSLARSGDRDAYAALVRKHHGAVLCLCHGLLSDPTEAEDAAQDVFVKAYRSLAHFRGDAAFSTWLHSVASHHCLDLLRKRTRRKTESWDALLEKEGERVERLLFGGRDDARPDENADLVRRVLDLLPPDYRAILILREWQGLSYQEIAAVLRCSLDAVKARLARARTDFEERFRHFLKTSNV